MPLGRPQPVNQAQNVDEQGFEDRDLRHLQSDMAAVAHHFYSDCEQLLSQHVAEWSAPWDGADTIRRKVDVPGVVSAEFQTETRPKLCLHKTGKIMSTQDRGSLAFPTE